MKLYNMTPRLFVISIVLSLVFSGCSDDFFNKPAGDRITPDQHYNNLIDGLRVSWPGAIITLQEAMPKMIMLDGLRSDLMVVTENADQYLRELNEGFYSPFNPYTDTDDLYKVIVNVNEQLAHIDSLAARERELDDYTTNVIKGEFIAMRAWVYFQIARIHGEVVYHPDNLETLPEKLIDPTPKDVIIDTLINQLLPYIYDPASGMVEFSLSYYVNPKGILGQLYLEQGDYANAITYLKLACESFGNNSSLFKVDGTYRNDAWQTIHLNAETAQVENMATIPFSSVEHQLNPLPRWIGYNYEYLVKPSQTLVDSFTTQMPAFGDPGDQYRGLGITFGVDSLADGGTENYILKYEIDKADPYSSDIILQRAADLHLLLAEAYNRMGDEESEYFALMLLNQGANAELPKPPPFVKWSRNRGIRGRVNLSPKEVPNSLGGNARIEYIEDLIMDERALELAFEGNRFFDLVRVAERRGGEKGALYLAEKVASKFEKNSAEYNTVLNRMKDPVNWYIPAK